MALFQRSDPDRQNGLGISLMVAAMFLFALADMAIKLASEHMAAPQIIFAIGLGGTICFVAIAAIQGAPLFPRSAAHPAVLTRNASEIVGTSAMIAALATTPLTIVGAILQASPLVVMAGAALLLGETVGWRRWSAAFVGFAGVLVVLQPWSSGIAPGALLAVLAMICLSARDLLNRLAPRDLPTSVLAAHGLAAILAAGTIWALLGPGAVLPQAPPWSLLGLIVASATAAYFAITASVRAAPVSVVAPFRYTRLLFLGALGIVILGEQMTWSLALGALLIIASGLYVLAREGRTRSTLHTPGSAP